MFHRLKILRVLMWINIILISKSYAQHEVAVQKSGLKLPLFQSRWDPELNIILPFLPQAQLRKMSLNKKSGKANHRKLFNSKRNDIQNRAFLVENDSLSFHTRQVTDTISVLHSFDRRSFTAGQMNIKITNPSINEMIPDKKISLPLNFPRQTLPNIPEKNFQQLKSLQFPLDSSGLSHGIQKITTSKTMDQFADRQFAMTRQGNELQTMAATTSHVKSTEDEIDKINFREIKESAKNSRIMQKALNETIINNPQTSGEMKEKIQAAETKMTRLKNKNSCLPSSLNPSRGIKRNSLKNISFFKRMSLGGSVSLKTFRPFTLDLSPSLAYRVNRNFRTGLTGQYRISVPDTISFSKSIPVKLYGFGLLAEYFIAGGFFAHLELDKQISQIRLADNKIQVRRTNGLLIGIGKEYRIAKGINGTCLLLYDTLHKNTSPYSTPWQVRLGVNIQ